MKIELLTILACPICKSELVLKDELILNEEIETGFLVCSGCSVKYPIEQGIPNLLPPNYK
ncbi:MAG TPA: hypothetical protein DEZ08_01425 [Dehalococcoidia bacterium]|jgi:uncharacterized protein|nr:hypothetical protein [Dehalococcoidia bacterium]|tara:strand:- start:2379 stop:2558 length:180 start_codon:yes stop_codon:yes gene_type:complete